MSGPKEASTSTIDCIDRINMNASVVRAICDATKLLAALERAVSEQADLGEGMAGGFKLCNATLPDLMHHAAELVSAIKEDANTLWEAAHPTPAAHITTAGEA